MADNTIKTSASSGFRGRIEGDTDPKQLGKSGAEGFFISLPANRQRSTKGQLDQVIFRQSRHLHPETMSPVATQPKQKARSFSSKRVTRTRPSRFLSAFERVPFRLCGPVAPRSICIRASIRAQAIFIGFERVFRCTRVVWPARKAHAVIDQYAYQSNGDV